MGASDEEIDKFTAEAREQKINYYPDVIKSNRPEHRVRISKPFYLSVCDVTVQEFSKFVQASGYRTEAEKDGKGGYVYLPETRNWTEKAGLTWQNPGIPQEQDHPVIMVSWNDTQSFCTWLNGKEGRSNRLPTEAEWEYACRAGTTSYWNLGNDPSDLQQAANVADKSFREKFPTAAAAPWDDGYPFTAPVGRFKPNHFGLYDMHGNVWQWCQD